VEDDFEFKGVREVVIERIGVILYVSVRGEA